MIKSAILHRDDAHHEYLYVSFNGELGLYRYTTDKKRKPPELTGKHSYHDLSSLLTRFPIPHTILHIYSDKFTTEIPHAAYPELFI